MSQQNQRRNGGGNQRRDRDDGQALMVVQPPRLPMPQDAAQAGYNPGQWKALVDAVFPSAKSVDGVMLAIRYCQARKLDVFKRVVHVVPMWSSALGREIETVWPGIGEMRTTASRTGQWAGTDECEFGRVMRQGFSQSIQKEGRGDRQPYAVSAQCPEFDFPEWAQVTVYKIVAGQRVAFVGPKVRFLEIFSGVKGLRVPNDRWRQAPFQMLEKCAEAAALRRAFPDELGDEWTSDEMEGKEYRGEVPSGDFTYVEPKGDHGDGGAGPVDDGGNHDDGGSQQQRDLRGWAPNILAEYVDYLQRGFASVQSEREIEKAMAVERVSIEKLPDVEARQVERYIAEARERVKPAERPKEQPKDIPEQPKPGDQQPQRQEPPYLVNFRLRLDEIETMVDINSLEASERRTIEDQPAWVADICRTLIEGKRADIAADAQA